MFIAIFGRMKALLFFIIFGLTTSVQAQFLRNDFSDPDLSDWQGDLEKFSVSNGLLQLSDSNAGSSNTAYLSIPAPNSTLENTIWETWVRLDFSPSTSNFARLYLSASNPNLNEDQQGYYLMVGGISGDQDAVELYRQDGSNSTLLISGSAGAVGGSSVLASVQVTRNETGLWRLAVDYTGEENFQQEGEAIDETYPMGRYFGFYCRYSSTRSEAFFFDDVLVDPLFEDQTPPVLLSATPLDQNTLAVQFDEAIDSGSATFTEGYFLSDGFGNPTAAERSPEDPSMVVLEWDQNFLNLNTYTLNISGITDESGNAAPAQSAEFTYLEVVAPTSGDLLVTEIMADPSPTRGLPDAEFLELYNAGDKVLQLEGIAISTGGSPRTLPAFQLLPGNYLILCDEDEIDSFEPLGPTLGIAGLPALTNGGDQLSLTDNNGNILVDLIYDLSWYRNREKSNGGWSLELIQLDQSMDCPGNWIAAQENNGGTPGQENSVNGRPLETFGPVLLSAYAESDLEVFLRFDEPLDESTAGNGQAYTISGNSGISDAFLQAGNREVLLILSTPLQPGTVYEVSAGISVTDCLGNPVEVPVSRRVGLAEIAAAGDLVINELLFFPEVGGEDFIELYNRSEKTINLRDWFLKNQRDDGSERNATIDQDFLIFPGEYVVISDNPQDILDRYTVNFPERLLANELPTLGDEGRLSVSNADFVVIDSFAYSADLHSPLLDDERGVSLERVDAENPTNSPGNWHSAAGAVGFATPTDENSQYLPVRPAGSNVISLAEKRFSPDGDGFEDLLLLQVEADRPGYLASIQIFDANGRLVRRLLRNEILPTNGLYKWDGTHEDGRKARIGIYVIWVELVNPDGTVERWQEGFVLAGNLNE